MLRKILRLFISQLLNSYNSPEKLAPRHHPTVEYIKKYSPASRIAHMRAQNLFQDTKKFFNNEQKKLKQVEIVIAIDPGAISRNIQKRQFYTQSNGLITSSFTLQRSLLEVTLLLNNHLCFIFLTDMVRTNRKDYTVRVFKLENKSH